MKCVGLENCHAGADKPSDKVLHCMHTKKVYECGKEVPKCSEPCGWSCSHHQCTKLCHEICDRKPCENKCPLTLECGHQCVGLCGEPCISICPECDRERFSALLAISAQFSPEKVYTQLPNCGHILPVQDMDKYVHQKPSSQISPLQCPACSSLLSCSYRYGNPAKKALSHVDAVREKVSMLMDDRNLSTEGKDRLNEVIKHSFSCISQSEQRKNSRILSILVRFNRFKVTSRYHSINKEEAFVVYLLCKVFEYNKFTVSAYQHLSDKLLSMAEDQKLCFSFQIIDDLLSEVYRLIIESKISLCKRDTLTTKEEAFLRIHNDPLHRMSRKDFISHSMILDILMSTTSPFESTNKFIRDIDYFIPPIVHGCWQKCVSDHYYCVPHCTGNITMMCPECTGVLILSFHHSLQL